MAPPHTMKHKDEPEIPIKMNPPLSAIINDAKANAAQPSSPTSLTPRFEALHINLKSTTPLSHPTPIISPKLSPRTNVTIARLLKEATQRMNFTSNDEVTLLFFSCARTPGENAALKTIYHCIDRIKDTLETLASSDSEDRFTETDRNLVILLIKENKEFVTAFENFEETYNGDEKGLIWKQEVRQIKGLCGEWEAAYPEGMWTKKVEMLGAVDEKICTEFERVKDRIPKVWEKKNKNKNKKRNEKGKKGGQKSGGEESDSGGSSVSDWSVDASDGSKSDVVGQKKGREKNLAEELKCVDSSDSEGSVKESDAAKSDFGNESMEYISPSKIIVKEELEQDFIPLEENFAAAMKAPGTPLTAVSEKYLPPNQFDLNFSPSRRAAKSLRTKSPHASSPKARRPVSPVQGTPTPAQSLPVAAIPKSTFDFTFGPAITAAKPARPSFPVQSTPAPTLAQPVATSPSKAFNFDFVPFDTKPNPSQLSSPIKDTPTFAQGMSVLPVDSSFGATITMAKSSRPYIPTQAASTTSQSMAAAPLPSKTVNFKCDSAAPPHIASAGISPASVTTPPVTPVLAFNPLLPRETRTPTSSTLTNLAKTTQLLQVTVGQLHTAVYGLDPRNIAPRSAVEAGLLKMNNCVGEWVTDIRIQAKTLDTKVNEVGTLAQSLTQEVATLKTVNEDLVSQLAAAAASAAEAEKNNTEALNETKDMMGSMMKEMKAMREEGRIGFSALMSQNAQLFQELATVKQLKSLGEEEVRFLRAENQTMRKLVEKLAKKVEGAQGVECEHCVEEVNEREDEDALMKVLWPQGDGRWVGEGVRKRGENMVRERGVLANEPGFRVPMQELGGKGKPGGGWCTIM